MKALRRLCAVAIAILATATTAWATPTTPAKKEVAAAAERQDCVKDPKTGFVFSYKRGLGLVAYLPEAEVAQSCKEVIAFDLLFETKGQACMAATGPGQSSGQRASLPCDVARKANVVFAKT